MKFPEGIDPMDILLRNTFHQLATDNTPHCTSCRDQGPYFSCRYIRYKGERNTTSIPMFFHLDRSRQDKLACNQSERHRRWSRNTCSSQAGKTYKLTMKCRLSNREYRRNIVRTHSKQNCLSNKTHFRTLQRRFVPARSRGVRKSCILICLSILHKCQNMQYSFLLR